MENLKKRVKQWLSRFPSVLSAITQSLRAIRRQTLPREEDYYLDLFSRRKNGIVFMQIGAHDGKTDDHLYKLVTTYHWKGILIEPVRGLFKKLVSNYAGVEGLIFENKAISNQRETRPFYRVETNDPSVPDWGSQLGSFSREHILKHRTHIPNIERFIVEDVVECVPPSDLLQHHGFTHLDVLLVDAEGYDFEILKVFNFRATPPSHLVYEVKHLSRADAMACRALLEGYGYVVVTIGNNCMAIHQKEAGWKHKLHSACQKLGLI